MGKRYQAVACPARLASGGSSSPSPLNGERAGVRGEAVRLITRFMGRLVSPVSKM